MSSLLICWVVGPVAALLVAVGLSALVELISGVRLPWALRPGVGLLAMILLAQIGVSTDATAELTIPAIAVLGAIGLILGATGGLARDPIPGWTLAAAVAVFLVYGAPVLLSGEATWAGYIKLDDTATWMGFSDHAFEFGRRINGFPPSTYEALISINAANGYPIGSFVPMTLMGRLVGQDVAWTIQPSMAFMAAILTLNLGELVRPILKNPRLRAAVIFLGAQSAILLGYTLWGGVKEVAAAALLPIGPLLAWHALQQRDARWPWILPGLAVAAFLGVLGPGGMAWLVPTMVPLVVVARRELAGAFLPFTLKALGVAAVATVPILITPRGFYDPFQKFLFEATELGNLAGPLSIWRVVGVWPATDFRASPHLEPLVVIVALLLVGFAVFAAVRGRNPAFAAYVLGGALAAAIVYTVGSPWIDGKAMAILSPALLTAGLTGVTMFARRTRFNVEGWVLASLVTALILWSSYLAFAGAWLAPRDEHRELEKIGRTFAGQGPALITEGSIYGPRHFLRKLDPEHAKDLRRNPVTLRNGSLPDDQPYVDVDAVAPSELARYRLLVFRRAPGASRPGGDFRLAFAGKYYEVWERAGTPVPGKAVIDHLPLGEAPASSAIPDCGAVQALAARAGPDATLLAAHPKSESQIDLTSASIPAGWTADATSFTPSSPGTLTTTAEIRRAGSYLVWVGGDILRGLEVSAGGQPAEDVRQALNLFLYEPFGPFNLAAGTQTLALKSTDGALHPGSEADQTPLGPIIVEPAYPGDLGMIRVPGSEYQQLCGKPWDWIEAYS